MNPDTVKPFTRQIPASKSMRSSSGNDGTVGRDEIGDLSMY
ncbi:hypothetical protein O9993_02305 [Vibrio lentus]|nr:hypothetical protein [Vibrio lentus]